MRQRFQPNHRPQLNRHGSVGLVCFTWTNGISNRRFKWNRCEKWRFRNLGEICAAIGNKSAGSGRFIIIPHRGIIFPDGSVGKENLSADGSVGKIFIGRFIKGPGLVVLPERAEIETMNKLDDEVIERLASRKGVRKIAVENFLSSLDGLTGYEAFRNLDADARSYKWNAATRRAIRDGLSMAY